MSTILFVTVGGSYQPIVTAIDTINPDRVVFICSDGARGSKSQITGTGTPCEVRQGIEIIERLPNIPIQTNLGDRFQPERDLVILNSPDDITECYQKIAAKIQELQQSNPRAVLKADYTGGTKTMSAGLAMAAVDYNVKLLLTTGNRQDLIRVRRGEMTMQTSVAPVLIQRTFDHFLPMVLQQYNYPAAIAELTQIVSSMNISIDLRRKIQAGCDICKGLDAWDRFEHLEAIGFLEGYMQLREIQSLGLFLKRVIRSRGSIDLAFQDNANAGTTGHGYEIVQDLLLNADRRAAQGRYDDAVGRLYRALELLAQLRLLKEYQLETGNLDIDKLPAELQSHYQKNDNNGKIQIALKDSYQLLLALTDPIGQSYDRQENQILQALTMRNNSLFAHGFQPVSNQNYQIMKDRLDGFITEAIALVIPANSRSLPVQFPLSLGDVLET
jgi:CRISPR-associated protein (TIGR02710 family)